MKTMVFPPSTAVLACGEHMALKDALEELFCAGCVARMNIYSKEESETVYVEFHPIPLCTANETAKKDLLQAGELVVGKFTVRPQLIV
jgi:hypothetical protein